MITCKRDVIQSLSTASIMGCHCKHRIQTRKKKKNRNWELFNASMMINVDILTDYKQGKCMKINSNNGLFLFIQISDYTIQDSYIQFPLKDFLMKGPWSIPWARCLSSPCDSPPHLVGLPSSPWLYPTKVDSPEPDQQTMRWFNTKVLRKCGQGWLVAPTGFSHSEI